MGTSNPWQLRPVSREIHLMWNRSIDLDTPHLVLTRRLDRGTAPSPERTRNPVSVSSIGQLPSQRARLAWRPVNVAPQVEQGIEASKTRSGRSGRHAGTPPRPIDDGRRNVQQADKGKKSPREAEGERTREDDDPSEHGERRSLPDRDWRILTVDDRKIDESGVLHYFVRWEHSVHPTTVLFEDESGSMFVDINGELWPVAYKSTTHPGESGEHQSILEWRLTWHPLWRLRNAIDLVLAYETGHPRPPTSREEPELHKYHVHLDDKLDPETDSVSEQGDFEVELEPEAGVDYTMSFLAHQLETLRRGETAFSGVARYLNHPVRQLLIFSDAFTDSGRPYRTGGGGRRDRLRAVFVYIIGHAWVEPCDGCQEREGPFRKCVTFRNDFYGACTNCVHMGRGRACGLHHENRTGYLQSRKNTAVAEHSVPSPNTPHGAGTSRASSLERNGPGSRSSVEVTDGSGTSSPASSVLGYDHPPSGSLAGPFAGPSEAPHRKRKRDELDESRAGDGLVSARPAAGHVACRRRKTTMRCIDPEVGCPSDRVEDGSTYPPHVVFHDRRFDMGEADERDVRYVVSRLPCTTAEALHAVWLDHVERKDGTDAQYRSKWEFLSCLYSDVMNRYIACYCPVASKGPVHIVIDD